MTEEKAYETAGIPSGSADYSITEGCLVLEGGAFRGLYTQGVLDALMLNGINMRCVIGVSAGALAGVNYVSGQIGRSARINIGFRRDGRYIGLQALARSRSILDVGFLTDDRGILEPFDRERFYAAERRFEAVATDLESGEAVCFKKGECRDIMLAVKASATMPFISPPVVIDGIPYLDGGCSCAIPFRRAMDSGFRKIVVVRTREPGFRNESRRNIAALGFYRRYPRFAEKLANCRITYNSECIELEELAAEGRVFMISPSERTDVRRIEGDLGKLAALYRLGMNDCISVLRELCGYLEIEYPVRGSRMP